MKQFKLITLLFSFIIILSSCNSDDNENNSTDPIFKGKLNGVEFTANTITNSNLIHQNNGINQSATLVFYAENDNYKFTFTIADYNNETNCPGEGEYDNSMGNREVILWVSYKQNGNTYMVHAPINTNDINSGSVNITNCNNNKISGTFNCEYDKMGDFDDLTIETPETLSLTDGVFENIEFNVVN